MASATAANEIVANGGAGEMPDETEENQQQTETKKQRPDNNNMSCLKSLRGFSIREVLGCDVRGKTIFLHAGYKETEDATEEQRAVILLEKKPFEPDCVNAFLSDSSTLRQEMNNDIYSLYHLRAPVDLTEIKATVILPATERHVEKYRFQDMFMLQETIDDYRIVTLPYIQEQQLKLQWVYNILDGKAEQDRVWYEDSDPETGFLIAPDLKWDGKDANCLYVQALVRKHGIKSIRDLTAEHVPMLERIRDCLEREILQRTSVPKSRLRLFFHYPPSYYHLHVHAVHLDNEVPGQLAGKAVLLADVIDNIKQFGSDFYQKKTMSFCVKKTDGLYERFVDAGRT